MENMSSPVRKFTPAAQAALDEFVDDFREKIIDAAYERAVRESAEVKEISVADVYDAIAAVGGRGRSTENRRSRKGNIRDRLAKITWAYASVGVIAALLGLVGAILDLRGTELANKLDLKLTTAVVIGLVFTVVATLFVGLQVLLARPNQAARIALGPIEWRVGSGESDYLRGRFLELWSDLEGTARLVLADRLGESQADAPFSRLVERLPKLDGVTDADANDFLSLLRVRNDLVHDRKAPTPGELKKSINKARHLLGKLGASSSRVP